MRTTVIGAHPGGTVRIGELPDKNCQTEIRNCYCMDASIIPEPWGVPPTVTIVAMAKRLARHLTAEIPAEASRRRMDPSGPREARIPRDGCATLGMFRAPVATVSD